MASNYGYGNWPPAASLINLSEAKKAKYQKSLDFLTNLESLNAAVPGRVGTSGAVAITPARWQQIFALYQPPNGTIRVCKDWVSLQSKMSRSKKVMLDIIEENRLAEEIFEETDEELQTNEIRIGFETNKQFK